MKGDIISIPEACQLIDVTSGSVFAAIQSGKIKRVGNGVTLESVQQYIRDRIETAQGLTGREAALISGLPKTLIEAACWDGRIKRNKYRRIDREELERFMRSRQSVAARRQSVTSDVIKDVPSYIMWTGGRYPWAVRIVYQRRSLYIGSYESVEKARAAYLDAEMELYRHYLTVLETKSREHPLTSCRVKHAQKTAKTPRKSGSSLPIGITTKEAALASGLTVNILNYAVKNGQLQKNGHRHFDLDAVLKFAEEYRKTKQEVAERKKNDLLVSPPMKRYKGVLWHSGIKRWIPTLAFDKKVYRGAPCRTQEEGYEAYKKLQLKVYNQYLRELEAQERA